MKWVPEYNTGIDVIDDQHRRILDYINEIDAIDVNTDRERVKQILENIIDYTQSHFTFEESLQEEAGYKYRVPHKRVHDLFIKKYIIFLTPFYVLPRIAAFISAAVHLLLMPPQLLSSRSTSAG